ncbi:hypothetical protein [Encephalitozoon cuniculi GB-M1]|uniref:Uncharacterized protein n=1 Tax=Encephalitozoon cuniculi (strain GB-M1) TaxID=284813 RepID=Q8SVV8_ENCCU|nr:uncharacterized protein ECU04_0550 [Encephalitozoon cuniculi GB-M1]CAD25242.1 hypothetical protein [Encephalitozoon cuniculi GB-M1]
MSTASKDNQFSFTYMMHGLHRMVSKGNRGIMWSACGKKVIIADRNKLRLALKRMLRSGDARFSVIGYMKKSGFIDEGTEGREITFTHPCFVRGRTDLLRNFTLKNAFCWAHDICVGDRGKPDCPLSLLKLRLFDLDRTMLNLRNSCLDLSLDIQNLLHMARSRAQE